jgi:GMP synthase-like glutamine amidotransferase
MSKVLVIQNISREGLGLLEGVLKDAGLTFDIVDLSRGQKLPASKDYRALIVLGGPMSANDNDMHMISELTFVKNALDKGIPYLGICLGLQVLVKAADGKVVPNKVKEIGFTDPRGNQFEIEATEQGKRDLLLKGLGDKFKVFQLHGETVELAKGMQTIAKGEFCEQQIVKVGPNAYGIQSHFELTQEMLDVWSTEDPDLIPIGKAKLHSDFNVIKLEYTRTGQTLLRNFLKVAGLV